MEIIEIRAEDFEGSMVNTTTEITEYELTDFQESNTACPQSEYLWGSTSAITA